MKVSRYFTNLLIVCLFSVGVVATAIIPADFSFTTSARHLFSHVTSNIATPITSDHQKSGQASISELLNADGTLKPGMNGSFDANGYQMRPGVGGAPIFLQTTNNPDDYWDSRFFPSGVDRNVYAIAVSGSDVYVGGDFINAGGKSSYKFGRYSPNTMPTTPMITPVSTLTRQQGSPGIVSMIATVSDVETAAGNLIVTATTIPTGMTVTNITNTNGTITANVSAAANASVGNNTITLTVTDGDGLTATANLIVSVTPASNTTTGNNVTVTANNTTVTFSNVTTAGNTTITPIDPATAGTLPSSYSLLNGSLAFEVTTTAVFSGPITLTFNVPSVTNPTVFSTLRVLHGEGIPQTLVDRTVLAPDTPAPNYMARQISARVTALSPFVIAAQNAATDCSGITFTPLGSVPSSTLADLNGDNKLDALQWGSSERSTPVLTVRLNNGNGTFGNAIISDLQGVPFSSYTFSRSPLLIDVNGDGKKDLIFGTDRGFDLKVSVFLQKTNMLFELGQTLILRTFPPFPQAYHAEVIVAKDFNKDGKVDIFVQKRGLNNDGGVPNLGNVILSGNGDGTFTEILGLGINGNTFRLTLEDLDRDGFPDYHTTGEKLEIYFGNSNLNFLQRRTTLTWSSSASFPRIFPVHFNDDEFLDFIATGSNEVYLGNSSGTFTKTTSTEILTDINELYEYDLNNDGKLDRIVFPNLGIYLRKPDGSYMEVYRDDPQNTAPSKRIEAVSDFTGDGKPDILTRYYDSSKNQDVYDLLRNNPDGSFTYLSAVLMGNFIPIITADFNSDGKTDIATPRNGVHTILKADCTSPPNNTPPMITAGPSFTRQQGSTGIVSLLATVNDAETAASNLTVTATTVPTGITITNITNTNGTITANVAASTSATLGNNTVVLTVTDAGGLTATANLVITVTAPPPPPPPTGCAVTSLQSPTNYATAETPSAIAHGDFNGDSKVDIVTANYEANGISILLNDGNGGFAPYVYYTSGGHPKDVAVGDLNGDGKLDLVVANLTSFDLWIFRGNGDGTFSVMWRVTGMNYPTSVAIDDLNGDGKADLVVANSGSFLTTVLYGNGDGTFAFGFEHFNADGGMPYAVTTGDFNKDGRKDFAVAFNTRDAIGVYLNLPSGLTNNIQMFPAGDQPIAIAAGDFDGNGTDDVAVANYGSNNVTVVTNLSAVTTMAVGSLPESLAVANLNGDASQDLIVGNAGTNFVSLLTATTGGQFTRQDVLGMESPSAVAATDFNGDGKVDVMVADYWVNRITTYQGTCSTPSALEAAPNLQTLRYVRSKYDGYPNVRSSNGRRGATTRPHQR